jgi:hypothetical protein
MTKKKLGKLEKLGIAAKIFLQKESKPLAQVIKEILYLRKSKQSLGFYFTSLVIKRDAGNLDDYIPSGGLVRIMHEFYRQYGIEDPILQDKVNFQKFAREHNLPTPQQVGRIEKSKLIHDSNIHEISSLDDFKSAIGAVLEIHKPIFVKIVDGQGGENVFKITNCDYEQINQIYPLIDTEKFIIEKALVQHKDLDAINESSINTLRIITYKEDGLVHIASAMLRMAVDDSYVDNGSSGGIFINYDIYENRLDKTAYNLFEKGGRSFIRHPKSKVVFEGMTLPYPEKIIETVTRAAAPLNNKIIGWDIAYTPDGPVLIEGNDNPHLKMMQITTKGLLTNKYYRKAFKKYKK